MKYLIRYQVEGFNGPMLAGPYEAGDELDSHREDIATYQGVHDVTIYEAPSARVVSAVDTLTPEVKHMISEIREWVYTDSCVTIDVARLAAALQSDLRTNGGRFLTDEECERFVLGDDDGLISEELTALFPGTHELLNLELC